MLVFPIDREARLALQSFSTSSPSTEPKKKKKIQVYSSAISIAEIVQADLAR